MSDLTPTSSGTAVAGVLQNFSTTGTSYLLALWLGDPGNGASPINNGTSITEVSGGGYGRQVIQFGAPNSAGAILSTNTVSFTNLPIANFDHIALFDSTSTIYIWGGTISGGLLSVTAGSTVNFVPGSIQGTAN